MIVDQVDQVGLQDDQKERILFELRLKLIRDSIRPFGDENSALSEIGTSMYGALNALKDLINRRDDPNFTAGLLAGLGLLASEKTVDNLLVDNSLYDGQFSSAVLERIRT